MLLAGCSLRQSAPPQAGDEQQRRIVSLIPSLTEDLFAIGAGAQVVGVSAHTTYPAAAKRLPVVATSKSLSARRIVQLQPDLVVGIVSQANLLEPINQAGIATVTFADDTYDDIFRGVQGLGVLTGRIDAAQALVSRLRRRTAELRAPLHFRRKPRCLAILNVSPIQSAGKSSFIAALISLAGGTNAAPRRRAYAQYSPEALAQSDPDLIIADAPAGLMHVLDRVPWRELRAVRNHHVFLEPDQFNVPGPRYNASLAWLIQKFQAVQ